MLKDGAIFVTTPDDIFSAIKNHYQMPENLLDGNNFNIDMSVPMAIKNELCEVELGIIQHLEIENLHIDQLTRLMVLQPGELSVWLLMLELKGIIVQLPGRVYKIKRTFI